MPTPKSSLCAGNSAFSTKKNKYNARNSLIDCLSLWVNGEAFAWQSRALPVIARFCEAKSWQSRIVSSLRESEQADSWQSRVVASCAFCPSLAIPLRLLKKLRLCLVLPRLAIAFPCNDELTLSLRGNAEFWSDSSCELLSLSLSLSRFVRFLHRAYLIFCKFLDFIALK